MRLDEFNPDIVFAEWLFTVAVGLGLGLVVAGLVLAMMRPAGWRIPAAGLVVSGLALAVFTGTFALDVAPWHSIDLRLRPYLSTVAETAAMVGALALGAAITAALTLLLIWVARSRRLGVWLGAAAGGIASVLGLALFLPLVDGEADGPRHPEGTRTGEMVPGRAVLTGLDIPTGLAIAPNGDMLIVELTGRRILLAAPSGDEYTIAAEIPLGLAEGDLAFHGVFHPEYPDVALAYVAAQSTAGDERTLEILRVPLDGGSEITAAAAGIPTAQGSTTNHHGAGLAICDGYLYLSTSDGDSITGRSLPGSQRWAERARAQLPNSGFGQMMRWGFDGEELVPMGIFGSEYPSFAMGLRNPYGIGCDFETGFPVAADNGEKGFDQVRLIEPGSNHGWPSTSERVDIVPPWYDSGRASLAPTGIVQRAGDPGVFVISAFNSQGIYELSIDRAAGEATGIRLLTEVDGGAFSVALDPSGCVLYSDGSTVYRLQEPGCE